jgi:hypothetical protein
VNGTVPVWLAVETVKAAGAELAQIKAALTSHPVVFNLKLCKGLRIIFTQLVEVLIGAIYSWVERPVHSPNPVRFLSPKQGMLERFSRSLTNIEHSTFNAQHASSFDVRR